MDVGGCFTPKQHFDIAPEKTKNPALNQRKLEGHNSSDYRQFRSRCSGVDLSEPDFDSESTIQCSR